MVKIKRAIVWGLLVLIGIVIGLASIIVSFIIKDILATLGSASLLTICTVIIGVKKDIRDLVFPFLKILFGGQNGQSQEPNKSPGSVNIQIKNMTGDINTDNSKKSIVNKSSVGNQTTYMDKTSSETNKQKQIKIHEIYSKMMKARDLLNSPAEKGLKNKEEFDNISNAIDTFIDVKTQNVLYVDDNTLKLLDQVMGAFRHTKHELYLKLSAGKFNEHISGIKSFEFKTKCDDAKKEIQRELKPYQ